ncbi:MAG: SDR family NAD(P)-dependent oxidoreductase [Candidatus Azotimanducaceae bacterium WSBS_2022_MAG_OTU7]
MQVSGHSTSARNMKLADWEWIINVDLWGPIYAVKTFLPLIEEQEEGHINATSSMAGLISSQMMGACRKTWCRCVDGCHRT